MIKAGINIPGISFKESENFLLIAGPCVIESEKIVFETNILKHFLKNTGFLLSLNHPTEKLTGRKVILLQVSEI